MAGFENDVLVCKNINFNPAAAKPHLGIINAAGKLAIGTGSSSPTPEILAGSLTSPLGTISIGYSSPNITLDISGGSLAIEKINGDSGFISGSTVTIFSNHAAVNSGSSVLFENSGTISTLNVSDSSLNTMIGSNSGNLLMSGAANTALSVNAGMSLTSGAQNTLIGAAAGQLLTSGSNNVCIGFSAGSAFDVGTEASNITIGHLGVTGDSNIIRIGTIGVGSGTQNLCYIAGINGATPVDVNTPRVTLCDSIGNLTNITSGTSGFVLTSTGSSAPAFSALGTNSGLTAHGVVISEGTGAFAATTAGSAGQVLQSGGASADPSYSTATYPSTATATGAILTANGTNWAATTATYPATTTANQILYSSADNTVTGLATANSGVLSTSSAGVPSIDTTNFAVLTTGLQLKGNNTNTAPPAGFIGEQIKANITSASPTGLTSGTTIELTHVNLTSGVWDVSCLVGYTASATTSVTNARCSITTTQSSINTNFGDQSVSFQIAANVGCQPVLAIPCFRVLLSSTTTYYLNANATFTIGSLSVYGRISATRVG
jgi:hypothetical protein